jgi:hypothetical protein
LIVVGMVLLALAALMLLEAIAVVLSTLRVGGPQRPAPAMASPS